jgi:hypothetical protein
MIEKINEEKNKIILAILLIFTGSILRLALQSITMDLFFIIAVIAIISGLILGGYYTFIVPLSIMMITDLIIGNNAILLFTWSGFAILALFGYFVKSRHNLSIKKIPLTLGVGILGILVYDIWTNFGCFLGWYPKTIAGLTTCYTSAIPFTIWHLLSTTIALTLVLIPITILSKNLSINPKPMKKPVAIAIPTLLIIAAVISLIV